MSTLGDVQYIGGYRDACGGYHEYIRACSVHQGNIMMLVGGYNEYTGEYHDACGGYHKYIGAFNIN